MPPTSPRPSETRRADISDVLAISRKSGVKTVRSRVMPRGRKDYGVTLNV